MLTTQPVAPRSHKLSGGGAYSLVRPNMISSQLGTLARAFVLRPRRGGSSSAAVAAMSAGAEPVTSRYGVFLQATFDFIIVALAIFLLVKMINRLRRTEEAKPAAPPAPPRQEVLLEEIRDLLRQQR